MSDIIVRLLDTSDLHEDALKFFNRHQVTNRVRYKDSDTYLYKDDYFVDDWDEQKKQKVVSELLQCIATEGIVTGAYHKDRLIGFANVEGKLFGRNNEYLELPYIHLSKEYRGMGIGRRLFSLCCEKAKEKGAGKLYIAAHPSEESQQFYIRMGCVPAIEVNEDILAREPLDIQLEIAL